jgi:hypothetical protein
MPGELQQAPPFVITWAPNQRKGEWNGALVLPDCAPVLVQVFLDTHFAQAFLTSRPGTFCARALHEDFRAAAIATVENGAGQRFFEVDAWTGADDDSPSDGLGAIQAADYVDAFRHWLDGHDLGDLPTVDYAPPAETG